MKMLATTSVSIFTIDFIEAKAAGIGHRMSRGNIRSQMAAYVARGVIERVSVGEFRFTSAGKAEFSVTSSDEDTRFAASKDALLGEHDTDDL